LNRALCRASARNSERTKLSERQQSEWPTRSLLASDIEPRRRAPNPPLPHHLKKKRTRFYLKQTLYLKSGFFCLISYG